MGDLAEDSRSDQQLVEAVQRGEAGAFEVLYARHRQWVYRLAYRFVGNDADAWDVVQEAFLYLARKASTLVLTASLRTLLFTVVRSLAIKANGKRRRLVAGDELLATLPAGERADGNEDLLKVLEGLDLVHRQVVILRYVDDLSLEEIAQVLGVPDGTVKSRLHHAHRMLRDNPRCRKYFGEE